MTKAQAMNTYLRASRRLTPMRLPEQARRQRAQTNLLLLMPPQPMTNFLLENLQQAGYAVGHTYTEDELQRLLQQEEFDLILLYLVQADSDTFDLCVTVRNHSHIPLILLSDEKSLRDMIYGLSIGADAYIAMPFSFAELDMRIQATLRRAGQGKYRYLPGKLSTTPFTLNTEMQSVKVRGKEVPLTQLEYQLLRYLHTHPNAPISKQQLAQLIWGFAEEENFNFIEVAMWRLRKKIEVDPTDPQYLITVRGVGYQLNLPATDSAKLTEKLMETRLMA
ncbi:MAG: DNA-binding response regulator [Caldilinea sp. CFX5]|nr:DNA-binding response regulator [Caldilinea sp. CFX5]